MSAPAATKSAPEKGAALAERRPGERNSQAGPGGAPHDLLALQDAAGNRAVDQLLTAGGLPPAVQSVVNGGGQPLDLGLRAEMEACFGQDFSRVRVHTDGWAAESAAALDAAAYTMGPDVVFAAGQYAPKTGAGQQLLAHELAHVVQQERAAGEAVEPLSQPGDRYEADADRAAAAAGAGQPAHLSATGATPVVQRQSMDPRHARGYAGEQELAFRAYRFEDGWVVIRGPSGAAGHKVTTRGEDGLFYNVRTGELHIVDNKSFARGGNVGSATAIDPSRNLLKNLDDMIQHVEGKSPADLLNKRQDILRQLRQTRAAVRQGKPIPGRVSLVVRNAGGKSTGISQRLKDLGIEFLDVNAPRPGTPPAGAQAPTPPTGQSKSPGVAKPGEQGSPPARAQTPKPPEGQPKSPGGAKPRGQGTPPAGAQAPKPPVGQPKSPGGAKPGEQGTPPARAQAPKPPEGQPKSPGVAKPGGQGKGGHGKVNLGEGGGVKPRAGKPTLEKLAEKAPQKLSKVEIEDLLKHSFLKKSGKVSSHEILAGLKEFGLKVTPRRASGFIPLIGWGISGLDAWTGVKDIAHGHIILGSSTILVAGADIASDFLHLGDLPSAGGTLALSLTLQAETTAAQIALEEKRQHLKAKELNEYFEIHGKSPSDEELKDYFDIDMSDEEILLRYDRPREPSSEEMRDAVFQRIKEIQEILEKEQYGSDYAQDLQDERESLFQAKVWLEQEIKRKQEIKKQAEEKRKQDKLKEANLAAQQRAQAKPNVPPKIGDVPKSATSVPVSGLPSMKRADQWQLDAADLFEAQQANLIKKAQLIAKMRHDNTLTDTELEEFRAKRDRWEKQLEDSIRILEKTGQNENARMRLENIKRWIESDGQEIFQR